MTAAREALERLKQGNRRFAADSGSRGGDTGRSRRQALVAGQTPFAVVVGCSDSRVPVELVFDQGLGDLFVIRVAGNIAAPPQIASVGFAAQELGTRLVVVLGHTHCGAVRATLQALQQADRTASPEPHPIVDAIRPGVAPLLRDGAPRDPDGLMGEAVRANIHAAVAQFRRGSGAIEQLSRGDGLRIIGAEYALETGRVEFFDEP